MNVLKKVIGVLVVVLVLGWLVILFVDFFRVKYEKMPIFCLSEETKKYDDGEVYRCTGPGYKVYKYDRESISAIEFGPFFIKERTSAKNTK